MQTNAKANVHGKNNTGSPIAAWPAQTSSKAGWVVETSAKQSWGLFRCRQTAGSQLRIVGEL